MRTGWSINEPATSSIHVSYSEMLKAPVRRDPLEIDHVIYHAPATIVFWTDGTKTVVKCSPDDIYDPEKGLAMAICKKAYGNEFGFHKVFKKHLPPEPEFEKVTIEDGFSNFGQTITTARKAFENFGEFIKKLTNTKPEYNPVEKAYQILVLERDTGDGVTLTAVNDAIGYLGEALE